MTGDGSDKVLERHAGGAGARAGWIQEGTCSEDALALFQHPRLLEKLLNGIPMVNQQPGSFSRSDVSLCKGAQDAQHVLGSGGGSPSEMNHAFL